MRYVVFATIVSLASAFADATTFGRLPRSAETALRNGLHTAVIADIHEITYRRIGTFEYLGLLCQYLMAGPIHSADASCYGSAIASEIGPMPHCSHPTPIFLHSFAFHRASSEQKSNVPCQMRPNHAMERTADRCALHS
jgi:hypothetical protein